MEITTLESALARAGVPARLVKARRGFQVDSFGVLPLYPNAVNYCRQWIKPLKLYGVDVVGVEIKGGLLWLSVPSSARRAPSLRACQIGRTDTAGVGVDSEGTPVIVDFNRQPHILIAGETGSGKSVLIHDFILSLLLPRKAIALDIVDTKRVEYGYYRRRATVINDPLQAVERLKDIAYIELENRFKMLSAYGARNIDELRARGGVLYSRYIVIDELADLMLLSRYEVESALVRIAQLGRACGVHLILATQRPTVNVVTGLIKANLATRIALRSASVRDSITILDHKGSETLLGSGDAIIKEGYQERRFQACFVGQDEIKAIALG